MPPLPVGGAVLARLCQGLMGFTPYLYLAKAKRAVGGLCLTSWVLFWHQGAPPDSTMCTKEQQHT